MTQSTPPPLPPTPLNYQTPGQPPRRDRRMLRQFLIGLAAGSAISLLIWPVGWKVVDQTNWGWNFVWIIPGGKFVAAIVLICLARWRGLGLGVLCSIAVGFLIFFSVCSMNLKF